MKKAVGSDCEELWTTFITELVKDIAIIYASNIISDILLYAYAKL